jgi:uncharacterized OB-fold protein
MTTVFDDNMVALDRRGLPYLVGARRKSDGRLCYPAPKGREASNYESVELAREGTLWTYTLQRFRPKSPPYAGLADGEFEPFYVGYVELPNELIVESRLVAKNPKNLKIGASMCLALHLFSEVAGRDGMISVFRPCAEE